MFIHINMVGVNDGPAYSFWPMSEKLVFSDFHEGQLFAIYLFISKICSTYQLELNADK